MGNEQETIQNQKELFMKICNLITILCVFIRVETVLIFYFKFSRKHEAIGKAIVFVKKNLIICAPSVLLCIIQNNLFRIIIIQCILKLSGV